MKLEEAVNRIQKEIKDPALQMLAIQGVMNSESRNSVLPQVLEDVGIDPDGAKKVVGFELTMYLLGRYLAAAGFLLIGGFLTILFFRHFPFFGFICGLITLGGTAAALLKAKKYGALRKSTCTETWVVTPCEQEEV